VTATILDGRAIAAQIKAQVAERAMALVDRGIQPGLGYSAFMFARSDIANGWPVPAVLPVAAIRFDRVTLHATYIPALGQGINNGSVFYFFGKIAID